MLGRLPFLAIASIALASPGTAQAVPVSEEHTSFTQFHPTGQPLPSTRLGVTATAAVVQQDDRPSRKEPGTATLISLLVIGGGQIYAGDTQRGLMMLGGAYGAIIVGAALSSSGSCDYDSGFLDCGDGSYTPLYLGALAFVGIGIYSIIDAAPTARRMNAKNGYKASNLSAVIRGGPAGTRQLGLRVGF